MVFLGVDVMVNPLPPNLHARYRSKSLRAGWAILQLQRTRGGREAAEAAPLQGSLDWLEGLQASCLMCVGGAGLWG